MHIIIIIIIIHMNYPSLLSDFNDTWIFSTRFRRGRKTQNFMNIGLVTAELLHVARQTWRFSKLCALVQEVSPYLRITWWFIDRDPRLNHNQTIRWKWQKKIKPN